MFVYVATGPADIAACMFLSKTNVERFCAACAMFGCVEPELGSGVPASVIMADVMGWGVELPLLFCVARTEASFREASEIICLIFLLRRRDGFQFGSRKFRGCSARSKESRSCW